MATNYLSHKLIALPFYDEVTKAGGKIYAVGGPVRDFILGKQSKDLDIIVTGIDYDLLQGILENYGKTDLVGKSFGIIKFRETPTSEEIDVALPRTEKKTGQGYQGFEVTVDPTMSVEDEMKRRDLTINSLAMDGDGNIVDPFNGLNDIKNRIIKATSSDSFSEDPLRMLRVVQFATRFSFNLDSQTEAMIKQNASLIKEISPERYLIEFDKIVSKGKPIQGIKLLVDLNLFEPIFGFQYNGKFKNFDKVRTIGEFLYLSLLTPENFDILKKRFGSALPDKVKKEIDVLTNLTLFGQNKVENLFTLMKMYKLSPETIQNSMLIPNELKQMAQKYPMDVKQLDITGMDIMALGFKGKDIGDKIIEIFKAIFSDQIQNQKQAIIDYVKKDNLNEDKKSTLRELSEEQEKTPFAVFALIKLSNGKIAATTRPNDRNENNKIGLPGGKVDENENPKEAIFRESKEEGWLISGIDDIVCSKMISGKPIVWYNVKNGIKLENYKEKYRGIEPIEVSVNEISQSGYGNEFISILFENNKNLVNEDESMETPRITSFRELVEKSPKELKDILYSNWQAKQNPEWHPEGNTLKHIIVVTNRAINTEPYNINLILAGYFHDLGKMATYEISPKTGQPTAHGHENISADLVNKYQDFITELGGNPETVNYIVKNHMRMKPRTWDVMKDVKKDVIKSHPSFSDLETFSTIDKGGLNEGQKLKGGKADKLTLSKIVEIHKDKKPKVSIEDLMSQLRLGMKTEMEHTDSKKQAKEIAMDHLAEDPKYYTKLKKAKLEEVSLKKIAAGALIGATTFLNPSITKANQPIPIPQQQQQNQDKLPKKVSIRRSQPLSNPNYDDIHGALGSVKFKDDFSQRVTNELVNQFNLGKKPDVSNIEVSTYIQGNQIITEASCDIVESTDGIAYTVFTTRGSIGDNYEGRHDEQVDGLIGKLENAYGVAKQVGKTFNITFQLKGQDITYRQSFFVAGKSNQSQMQQSQQTQTISGSDIKDLRQKLIDQTTDISIDPNSIEIDMDNFSISYKLGNQKIKVISLIPDNAGQLETRLISIKNKNPTLEVLEKGKSGNVDWAVSIILADKSLKESLKYPIEDKGKWYGDEDYEKRNGKIIYMNPDEFLNKAKELKIDDAARENIDDIKEHIKNGKKLDPLALYSSDKTNVRNSDGRHRAIAAKELGIKKVPVIDFTTSKLREDAIPSKLKSDIKIEYHKKLNDKFWLNNHLKNNIRKNLLSLAKFYFKNLNLEGATIKDIIFTGSLANYNYTNLSDVDLHIVIDYKSVSDDVDFVKDYFSQKRAAWEVSNDVKINGYPVEIYVQDVNEDNTGKSAIYSLMTNKWIKKPKYKLPDVDRHAVTIKVNKYLDILNKISMMKSSLNKLNNLNKLFDKIKEKRGEAAKKEGEFSIDNIVFKVLRNKNVFDIIKNSKKEIVNKLFSMKTN